jgi:hypothetical protein
MTYCPAAVLIMVVRHFQTAPIASYFQNTASGLSAICHCRVVARPNACKASWCWTWWQIGILWSVIDIPAIRLVAFGAIAWDRHRTLRHEVPTRLYIDLSARNVILWIALVGVMKRQELRPHEVVPAHQTFREIHTELTASIDHLNSAPVVDVSHIPDLKPSITSGAIVECVVDFLEINCAGTPVSGVERAFRRIFRCLAVLEGQRRPIRNWTCAFDRRGALKT